MNDANISDDTCIAHIERVIYAGRVQGVGFRYTVRNLAQGRPIKGFVRNQPDGTVELVVQGPRDAVDDLLRAIDERFRGNIRGSQRHRLESSEPYDRFEIRF